MPFQTNVTGPHNIGATMAAYVQFRNAAGDPFTPPYVVVQAEKYRGNNAWLDLGVLLPGSKGLPDQGKCEYAPLTNGGALYRFRPVDATGAALGPWALCDLSRPFMPVPTGVLSLSRRVWGGFLRLLGQYHKSFLITFTEGEAPPPPPRPTFPGLFEYALAAQEWPVCLGSEPGQGDFSAYLWLVDETGGPYTPDDVEFHAQQSDDRGRSWLDLGPVTVTEGLAEFSPLWPAEPGPELPEFPWYDDALHTRLYRFAPFRSDGQAGPWAVLDLSIGFPDPYGVDLPCMPIGPFANVGDEERRFLRKSGLCAWRQSEVGT